MYKIIVDLFQKIKKQRKVERIRSKIIGNVYMIIILSYIFLYFFFGEFNFDMYFIKGMKNNCRLYKNEIFLY